MKLLIAGSRSIGMDRTKKEPTDNPDEIKLVFDILDGLNILWKPTEVISGNAMGADELGEDWASDNKIPVKQFKPDWKGQGKAAGFIRNKEMVEYCDKAVVFWDGISKGSKHTIDLLEKSRKEYVVWRFPID